MFTFFTMQLLGATTICHLFNVIFLGANKYFHFFYNATTFRAHQFVCNVRIMIANEELFENSAIYFCDF